MKTAFFFVDSVVREKWSPLFALAEECGGSELVRAVANLCGNELASSTITAYAKAEAARRRFLANSGLEPGDSRSLLVYLLHRSGFVGPAALRLNIAAFKVSFSVNIVKLLCDLCFYVFGNNFLVHLVFIVVARSDRWKMGASPRGYSKGNRKKGQKD